MFLAGGVVRFTVLSIVLLFELCSSIVNRSVLTVHGARESCFYRLLTRHLLQMQLFKLVAICFVT